MPRQQNISPNRPLTVEIPAGLDAALLPAKAETATAATEADIKLGERTAFIPMTCQERQVLGRLEAGLQAAACLWRESPQQHDHDKLLSSALHHWRSSHHQSCGTSNTSVSTSWVWEVGRWNSQYSLPFALELRRLDPAAMEDSDQLLALSTCLRNRQLDLAKRLAAASAADSGSSSSGSGGKRKAQQQPPPSLDELDDEPCLCQIRWGLAPDTEAAKRRQLEKLDNERHHHRAIPQQQPASRKLRLPHQPPPPPRHQQQQPARAGGMRPIVKTSHLCQQQPPPLGSPSAACDDAGYESQGCSPASRAATAATSPSSGFINDLLAASVYGARSWAD